MCVDVGFDLRFIRERAMPIPDGRIALRKPRLLCGGAAPVQAYPTAVAAMPAAIRRTPSVLHSSFLSVKSEGARVGVLGRDRSMFLITFYYLISTYYLSVNVFIIRDRRESHETRRGRHMVLPGRRRNNTCVVLANAMLQ